MIASIIFGTTSLISALKLSDSMCPLRSDERIILTELSDGIDIAIVEK